MDKTSSQKEIFTHVLYKFNSITLLLWILFIVLLTVFGYVSIPNVLFSALFVIILMALFQFTIFPSIKKKYDAVDALERGALDYNTGVKLLIRRDLELSRANEKLQEVDEIKSDIISVVSHQLRTPLSGVRWTLDMLLSGDLGEMNNDQKTFIMKTYESNNRMISLVNDMLDTDRIQSGKIHYGFRFMSIGNLFDNVLFEVNSEAVKKSITIEFKRGFDNLPQAFIDPDTMRSVIQNLLENAIKYTMDGGKIELDILTKENELEIVIKDSGIGIPEAQDERIFNRFYRASNAIKYRTDGTGLGLYIAKTIVEKNGGKIWFESVEGKGTTFHFTVPTVDKSLGIK